MSQDREQTFKDTIITLFEKATADGTISPETGAIIMKIKFDLSKYMEAVQQSEVDGQLTMVEAMELIELKNEIIANAGIIAAQDYEIQDDEKNLIRKLAEILNDKF